MTQRSGIWATVEQIVKNGQAPRVTLNPSAEVRPIKRAAGRPVFRDKHNPFAHYNTGTVGGKRPRCVACKKRLRRHHVEVCSDICEARFMAWASAKVARISKGAVTIELTAAAAKHLMENAA